MRALAIACLLAGGCTSLVCGKGTKQVQNQTTGNLECQPADAIGPTPCVDDADAGTVIVGGRCVAAIKCDPATTHPVLQPDGTIECVRNMNAGKVCSTPAAGTLCVQGIIRDFVSNAPIANLPVALYDPIAFLSNPSAATPQPNGTDTTDATGAYVMNNVPVPGANLIALASPDPRAPASMWYVAGAGAQVTANQQYKLDGTAVTRTVVSGWSTMAGIDYSRGAEVLCFFMDASRATTFDFSAYETQPVAGAQAANPGPPLMAIATAKYYSGTLDQIGSGTATTPLGCGIVAISALTAFTGVGPAAMKWEVHPGGSTAGVIFFDRFHPM